MDTGKVFDIVSGKNFSDLAEVLNDLFEIEISPDVDDDRCLRFDSTLYGEKLLIVPDVYFGSTDILELPLSLLDDWRGWVHDNLYWLKEEARKNGVGDEDDFVSFIMREWAESIASRIETVSGLKLKRKEIRSQRVRLRCTRRPR